MYEITAYNEKYENIWDKFVMEESVNGTFLQTRRFLNYHPEKRFIDASYMVFDNKQHLIAVCPACVKTESGEKILYSHGGSTYGGIIIGKKHYKSAQVIEIISTLENTWKADGFNKAIIKQTPSLISEEDADLFQYCFYYLHYQCCSELNLYVDLENYREDILSEFSQGKRTNVHNCQKRGAYYRKLTKYEEIERFYQLLEITLSKYEKKPVHTIDEIYEFQTKRLVNECECFGMYENDVMLAGSMMFYFSHAGVAHTQYLCADSNYNQLSPMTYMYYAMLVEMRKRGYKKVSWGIVTENLGLYLNEGLVKSKEYYGSKYSINPIFVKKLI